MNETKLLQKLIPYRMKAVDTLNYALRVRSSRSDTPSMTMHVNGKQIMKGYLNAVAKAAIEAGLVDRRACSRFWGCEKNGRL
jgi:hypothetical protein